MSASSESEAKAQDSSVLLRPIPEMDVQDFGTLKRKQVIADLKQNTELNGKIYYQLAYNVNREVIGAGRQGGTSVNICDFIPVFENPKKSHLATLLFSKLRTFDFSRRKINILGAILYFFWLWHENSNIFYFWHENSNEVIFYISHHHLNLGTKCRCM